MTKEFASRVEEELIRAYRMFGDTDEAAMKESVDSWLERLYKGEQTSKFTLADGSEIEGVDIHVAVRTEATYEDLLPPNEEDIVDGYITKQTDAVILVVGQNEMTFILLEYDIVDDIGEDLNNHINHKCTKIDDIAYLNGKFTTIYA